MLLKDLVSVLKDPKVIGNIDIEIESIAYDSRHAKPKGLFVAVPGFVKDGTYFVPEALRKGVVAVVVQRDIPVPDGVVKIIVQSSRKALANLANKFYDYPSRKLTMIGITGTNGKTTTSYMIEEILRKAGFKVGLFGTVSVHMDGVDVQSRLTTPDSLDLQAMLKKMVEAGITHVVMEVSSHSLALHRVMGTEFDIGIFTNLTHDHLDFHKMMEEYMAAKKKMFDWLGRGNKKQVTAVINSDDIYGDAMIEDFMGKIIYYKQSQAKNVSMSLDKMTFEVDDLKISTTMIGKFNIYNFIAAIKCAKALGIDDKIIQDALNNLPPIPGRFEKINAGQPFSVVVDFAHSPDSLQKILETVGPLSKGKKILLFGCPGDRDRSKRPMMGKIASKLADYTVITTDDPHGERPDVIIDEIEKGFLTGQKNKYRKIIDRKMAIEETLKIAQPGDVVILAGRGHEKFQDFAGKRIPLSDKEVAIEALKAMDFQMQL